MTKRRFALIPGLWRQKG